MFCDGQFVVKVDYLKSTHACHITDQDCREGGFVGVGENYIYFSYKMLGKRKIIFEIISYDIVHLRDKQLRCSIVRKHNPQGSVLFW